MKYITTHIIGFTLDILTPSKIFEWSKYSMVFSWHFVVQLQT
jgi:hypothetical protein